MSPVPTGLKSYPNLNGVWTLVDESSGARHHAQVPGTVHTDLLAAGVIPDPYHRDESLRLGWIAERVWVYQKNFVLPPMSETEKAGLRLRFDGLDTLAEIYFNGEPLGCAANAYRRHEFSLAKAVRAGENQLAVRFLPVPAHVAQAHAARPLRNWGTGFFQGIGHVRKPAYHFGWDWAPPLLPCGIWKSVTLVNAERPCIADLAVRQFHDQPDGAVALELSVECSGVVPPMAQVSFEVYLGSGLITAQAVPVLAGRAEARVLIAQPSLWWPLGLGAQPLYTVWAVLTDAANTLLSRERKRIGLRVIRLVQSPDADGRGSSFEFTANGVPFFARGANWVPADCFLPRIDAATYRRVVSTAAEENMNMLRVWGGGIYESEAFMDACDELGICVWHDFMFACATYPADQPAFLAEVRTEAEEAVRRLRHHASLVLWCGNNELEEGLVGPDAASQMLPHDYDALFIELLGGVVRELQPECAYIRSSGHGPGARRDPRNTWNLDAGDSHIWWHVHSRVGMAETILADPPQGVSVAEDFHRLSDQLYPLFVEAPWSVLCHIVPRFCSEWGRQSFPDIATLKAFAEEADFSATGRVMEHHQQAGNARLIHDLADQLPLPSEFSHLVVCSQIQQAELYRRLVELWRQSERCRGALFWTLNDCWPSVEWSQVDWYGRRKASYYLFRRMYEPVLLSFRDVPGATTIEACLHNDTRKTVAGEIELTCVTWAGVVLVAKRLSVSVPPAKIQMVGSLNLAVHLAGRSRAELFVAATLHRIEAPPLRAHLLMSKPKEIALPVARFSVRIDQCTPAHACITLTADQPALWVEVSLSGRDNAREVRYSDNYFHVLPGEAVTLELRDAEGKLSEAELRDSLRIVTCKDFTEPKRSTRLTVI